MAAGVFAHGSGVAPRMAVFWRLALAFHVFQAKELGLVVVREDFGVASPVDDCIKRFFGGFVGEEVFKLLLKAHARGVVARALVEDLANARRQRHRLQQVLGKLHFALLRTMFGKDAPWGS